MIETSNGAPTAAPAAVTLGGRSYTLRYSTVAEYVVDNLGVDLSEFFSGLRQGGTGKLAIFLKVFSAMVAHHFVAERLPIPGPEHWAAVIDAESDPSATTSRLCQAVGDTFLEKLKASAAKKGIALREPASSNAPGPVTQ